MAYTPAQIKALKEKYYKKGLPSSLNTEQNRKTLSGEAYTNSVKNKPVDDKKLIADLAARGIAPHGVDAALVRNLYRQGNFDKIKELSVAVSPDNFKEPQKQDLTKKLVPQGTIDPVLTEQLAKRGETEKIKELGNLSGQASLAYQGANIAKEMFVDPVGKALARPIVELKAGLEQATPGGRTGQEPVETPFGELTPMTIESGKKGAPSQYVKEAIDLGLSTLPVGKVAGKVLSKVSKPLAEGIAPFLTSVSKEKFNIAREAGKESFERAVQFVDEPSNFVGFGDEVAEVAKNLRKKASEAWQTDEKKLFTQLKEGIMGQTDEVKKRMSAAFFNNGIKVSDEGVDLAGTEFSQNPLAKDTFSRINNIINEPIKTPDRFLKKRAALTDILNGIPKTERNIRRVAKAAVDELDIILNDLTDNGVSKLRESYAAKVDPANKFLDAVTDSNGKLSHDKAMNYFRQAMSDAKFDKAEVLSELDKVAGTDFAKQVKLMGAAKALRSLAPETSGRIKDVLLSLGITKIPFAAALVSPRFWSGALVKSKAAKSMAQQTTDYLLAIMLQTLARETVEAPFDNND